MLPAIATIISAYAFARLIAQCLSDTPANRLKRLIVIVVSVLAMIVIAVTLWDIFLAGLSIGLPEYDELLDRTRMEEKIVKTSVPSHRQEEFADWLAENRGVINIRYSEYDPRALEVQLASELYTTEQAAADLANEIARQYAKRIGESGIVCTVMDSFGVFTYATGAFPVEALPEERK